MSDKNDVLVMTKARFAEIDMDRIASIRAKAAAVLSSMTGLLSMSLWEEHDDPFTFLIVSHFAREEDSLTAWDLIMRSPVFDIINDLMTVTPSTSRFYVRSGTGIGLEQTEPGIFLSMSTRIAGMGYSPELLTELSGIFQELKAIPGFLGGITGQMIDVEDEVLGLAFWNSKPAFDASIPEQSMYRISLYQRVL